MASFIGVEGGHSIDASLSVLRMFYDVGVRYLTLTHTCHTAWADSCGPQAPIHNGLTEFGVGVIKEMNRLGMLVDLSHVSHQSMRQAINVSLAPVIFSHSSAYSLCKTPRNVPDDVIESLMEKDGVVMVSIEFF